MSAKEMFEKLGYKLVNRNELEITYENINKKRENVYIHSIKKEQNNSALPKFITFWFVLKEIDFEYGRLGSYLYFELLQAINKQVEELGWLGSDDNE